MPLIISDGSENTDFANCVNIPLDATADSKFDFASVIPQIEKSIEEGKKLFFEFQFGLDLLRHNFKDQMQFYGFSIAIASFLETIYEPFKDHVKGVFLYRGIGNFAKAIAGHVELTDLYDQFVKEIDGDQKHLSYLFSLQILMEYLHRLGAALPDEVPAHVLLNFKGVSELSFQAELLAADHFPYIKPAVKGAKVPYEGFSWEAGSSSMGYIGKDITQFKEVGNPHVALLLPRLGHVPHNDFSAEIKRLNDIEVNYKIIPEDSLNQSWHLIDNLIVFEGCVSGEGKRMIDGFIAAGGDISWVKKNGALLV